MAFPTDIDGLRKAGYKHNGESTCKSCGADIEWWETPGNKHMPTDHGTAIPHWTTCPNAKEHRTAAAPTSKITTATLDMDWLKKQAATCFCTVCKKISGR